MHAKPTENNIGGRAEQPKHPPCNASLWRGCSCSCTELCSSTCAWCGYRCLLRRHAARMYPSLHMLVHPMEIVDEVLADDATRSHEKTRRRRFAVSGLAVCPLSPRPFFNQEGFSRHQFTFDMMVLRSAPARWLYEANDATEQAIAEDTTMLTWRMSSHERPEPFPWWMRYLSRTAREVR